MAADAMTATLDVTARDVTGQQKYQLTNVPVGTTIGELLRGVLARMGIGSRDRDGRETSFRARLEREGRHLLESERAGDALQPGDELVIAPRINAGARAR